MGHVGKRGRAARDRPAGTPPTRRRSTSRSAKGGAYVTSGDAGTLHVQSHDGRVLSDAPVPVGSYNVQLGLGRVITPSLLARDAGSPRRAGRPLRTLHDRRLVPRRLCPLRIYESLTASSVDLRPRGNMGASEARRHRHRRPCRGRRRPRPPSAAVPCRDRIYNDWYHDGKIATTYPIDVLPRRAEAHHADAWIYSSLVRRHPRGDAGRDRAAEGDTKMPAQVGNTGPAAKRLSGDRSTARARRTIRRPGRAGRTPRCRRRPRSQPERRAAAAAATPCRFSCSAGSPPAHRGRRRRLRRAGGAGSSQRNESPKARAFRRQVEAEQREHERVAQTSSK